MAGADAVMTTSALLRNGIGHMTTLIDGMKIWMEKRGYTSVAQMQGSMSPERSRIRPFERANYIKVLQSYRSEYVRRRSVRSMSTRFIANPKSGAELAGRLRSKRHVVNDTK